MGKLFALSGILIAGLLFSTSLKAQSGRSIQYREHPAYYLKNQRYFTWGAFIGALNYFGDLAPVNGSGSTYLPYTRPALGITGSYRLKFYLSLRTNLMWGRLKGDDISADKKDADGKFRYTRNLHFRNDIKELSVDLVFDFSGYHRTFVSRGTYTPFAFIGMAVFHHNPKALVPETDALNYDMFNAQPIRQNDPRYAGVSPGEWIALKPLGTEGQYISGVEAKPYSNWQLAIPVGMGLRLRLNRHYDLTFEIGFRQTFTDFLDDASGGYVDPDEFGAGPKANLARLMADRSKEPVAAGSGELRDLACILGNVHGTSPYGAVPAEFGDRPYDLIDGYGRSESGNIRGKAAFDIFIVTKLTFTYIPGKNFGLK